MDNPIRLVRELKGAPLSIIFALSMTAGQRVTQLWLERATGYTDKPISQALAYLEEIGLANHTNAGWQLTGQARQLPLPIEQVEAPEEESPEIEKNNSDTNYQGRNISDPLTTTTTTLKNINLINLSSSSKGESRNFSDSEPENGGNVDNLPVSVDKPVDNSEPVHSRAEIFQALERSGIVEPKRSELALLDWITPQAIHAHEMDLKKRKRGRYSVGLLIHVLESGEPAPANCMPPDGASYVSGEFAQYLEH